jgi:hypothetical protein
VRDLQERQQKSGRAVVALPPKRIESIESDTAVQRREAPSKELLPGRDGYARAPSGVPSDVFTSV